jgi:hypothetical protein
MQRSNHIFDKNRLWALIKRLGALYGESPEWVEEYAKWAYKSCMEVSGHLKGGIECFESLVNDKEYLERHRPKVISKKL